MAYVFNKETAAQFKVTGPEKTVTLKGINSQVTSADTIVSGLKGLMYLANTQDDYHWSTGIRVVNEDVDNNP